MAVRQSAAECAGATADRRTRQWISACNSGDRSAATGTEQTAR
jgi:hypothetical protein